MPYETFPYTNFHNLNLDWFLKEFSKVENSIVDFSAKWGSIEHDFGQMTEEFGQIVDAYNSIIAEWDDLRDNIIPEEIHNLVNQSERRLNEKYAEFLANYQRQFGITNEFGTSETDTISQNIATYSMLHYIDEPVTRFAIVDVSGYKQFTSTQLNNVSDIPEGAIAGTFVQYGTRTIVEGSIVSDRRVQLFYNSDGKVFYRTAPEDSDTFTEWSPIGAVHSVNGYEGDVTLTAASVGASPIGEVNISGVDYVMQKTHIDAALGAQVINFCVGE